MATTPTTPKGKRTRGRILHAARQIFARNGFVNARMTDVAEEAGLSLGAVYRYFKDKEELFEHLIANLHEELYEASRASRHSFESCPYQALLEANEGYLSHYYENRDVMRAFIEAANVDASFRDIWWQMRRRHIERFVHAFRDRYGESDADTGLDLLLGTEAMASMVEQVAYVWYAQESLRDSRVPVKTAAQIATQAWYRFFFEEAKSASTD